MLDLHQIEELDCEKLARDPMLRRTIIPRIRAYFRSKGDFDPDMDDATLMGYAMAKYHDRPFDPNASQDERAEILRRFLCLYQIPDYICSWFKEALKAELPQAA